MPAIEDLRENVPLAPFTTFGIGGPARYFIEADREEKIINALDFANANGLDVFILGGGSNILVSDAGLDALVIHIANKGICKREELADGRLAVTAAAGEDWDRFVEYCVGNGLAGVECLSGIPGLVGGTPIQNVGAYGSEVSETIVSVRCFDRAGDGILELSNADCGFSYRKSIFNSSHKDRFIVLEVTYALVPNGRPTISYRDLLEFFPDGHATLAETREAVLRVRRAKSMVIDPGDPNSQSAGSFFKNPQMSLEGYAELSRRAEVNGVGEPPKFPVDERFVKVPAAWLIENSGFSKGFRLGNAAISANHALALVNLKGATASEILALMEKIGNRVRERFGVELFPEPNFIGFD